jgi:NADP-dependent 3-hydroxy acid dehydrogenase YdfG
MAKPLTGTVALVTGASSGIGAATATRLSADGASLALVDRRRDRLEELASALRSAGGTAVTIEADITDQAQAIHAVERAVSELGRLDIVENNAGIMHLGPALGTTTEEWDQMLAINVQGLLYVTHAALPHLVQAAKDAERGVADSVNISSTAGRLARPGSGVYSLTKFGMVAFSESIRQELVKDRVRVSVVEPGLVATQRRRSSMQSRRFNRTTSLMQYRIPSSTRSGQRDPRPFGGAVLVAIIASISMRSRSRAWPAALAMTASIDLYARGVSSKTSASLRHSTPAVSRA